MLSSSDTYFLSYFVGQSKSFGHDKFKWVGSVISLHVQAREESHKHWLALVMSITKSKFLRGIYLTFLLNFSK